VGAARDVLSPPQFATFTYGGILLNGRTRLWAVIAIVALALGALTAAGCGGGDDNNTSTSGGGGAAANLGLKESGTLLVGSDIPYPPFEFGNAPDYTGFDVEMVNEIAKRLGVTPKYQDTSFDTIFTDLAAGQFDMVASASTITPDREKTVDFSDPYYSADQAVVVLPDNTDIKTVADLSGKTVSAQSGTTGEAYGKDKTDASDVQGYPQGPDAINALRAGQVEATIIDLPVAQDAVEKSGGVKIAFTIPTGELYGMAFPQDNDALREAVNKQLEAMKKDGSLDALYQKYFGIDAPKAVINGTTTPK
jgi:polar amino acid transport system substrate-binding protein